MLVRLGSALLAAHEPILWRRRETRKPCVDRDFQVSRPGQLVYAASVRVALGQAMLATVGEAGVGGAVSLLPVEGRPGSSWEHEASWFEISVEVELDPPPDWDWLTYWAEGDLEWPGAFDDPMINGSKLLFTAPENQLQQAWDAVKARVALANELAAEDDAVPELDPASHPGEIEAMAELRERAQRRIDGLR